MSDTPEFPKLDSAGAPFWEVRYRAGFTPWDAGGVPVQVQAFAARESARSVLVPGCGSGYEIACFAQAGWLVRGVDFSRAALERARERLGPHARLVEQADFFKIEEAYDAVYERTFFCALKPELRAAYAAHMARIIRPGGLLFGFFYYDDKSGGPPFAIAPAQLEALLNAQFERIESAPVPDSIPIFVGKERWEVWRRRG
jgi:SAM-dependent methyltransferase